MAKQYYTNISKTCAEAEVELKEIREEIKIIDARQEAFEKRKNNLRKIIETLKEYENRDESYILSHIEKIQNELTKYETSRDEFADEYELDNIIVDDDSDGDSESDDD